MSSQLIHATDGEIDDVESAEERTAAARTGVLVDHRPAPADRPDVVLELRRYVDPVDGGEWWAVITAYAGYETVTVFADEGRARREFEFDGDRIGAALFMGRADLV